MATTLKSIFTHVALLAYFWLANWYSTTVKNSLPMWGQISIGMLYLLSLLVFFRQINLITFSSDSFAKQISGHTSTESLFYAKVIAWYALVIGTPVFLLIYEPILPTFFRAYCIFIFFAILINRVDYSIPSYERYRRLVAEGRWGMWQGNAKK